MPLPLIVFNYALTAREEMGKLQDPHHPQIETWTIDTCHRLWRPAGQRGEQGGSCYSHAAAAGVT